MGHYFMVAGRVGNRGMVLALAMVFLLVLAVIAGGAMRSAALAFYLAGNDQFKEQALQQAESIVADLTRAPDNFPLSTRVGESLCNPLSEDSSDCSGVIPVPVAPGDWLPPGVKTDYRVIRQGPLLLGRLPVRLEQSRVSSSRAYRAAVFEARAEVDGSAVRLGSAGVAQGLAVLVAWPGQ